MGFTQLLGEKFALLILVDIVPVQLINPPRPSGSTGALAFLAEEAAICEHVVEREYNGLRLKTPDVEFKAHFGATGSSGGGHGGAEFGPGVRVKLLSLKARGSLDVRCLTFVTEHLDRLLGMALDAASEDEAAAKDLVKFMKNPNVG